MKSTKNYSERTEPHCSTDIFIELLAISPNLT